MTDRATQRVAAKEDRVADHVRREIVDGVLPPGARLPTRRTLQDRLNVSSVTVQRALDRLKAEGFIEVREGIGTYVNSRPPHRCRFALVFRECPSRPFDWSFRYDALLQASRELERRGDVQFEAYYDVDGHQDVEDYHRLLADARTGRIAGLIFASPPYWIREALPADLHDFPAVSLSHQQIGHVPNISHGSPDFVERAIALAAANGRRHVACVGLTAMPESADHVRRRAIALAASHGLATRASSFVPVSPRMPESGAAVVHLLMERPKRDRPDVILIPDDHLIADVTRGLVEAVGDAASKVLVIAQANYPLIPPGQTPVIPLGVDTRELLAVAVHQLSRVRVGQRMARTTNMPVRFEEELIPVDLPMLVEAIPGTDKATVVLSSNP